MTEAIRRSQRQRAEAEAQRHTAPEAEVLGSGVEPSTPAPSDAASLQQITAVPQAAGHPLFRSGRENAETAHDLEKLKGLLEGASVQAMLMVLDREVPLFDHEANCILPENESRRVREEKAILNNIGTWATDGNDTLRAGNLSEDQLRDLEHRAAVCRAILDMMMFRHERIANMLLALTKQEPIGFSVSDSFLPLVQLVQQGDSEESLRLVDTLDAWERHLAIEILAIDGTLRAFAPLLEETKRDHALRSSMLVLLGRGEREFVARLLKLREGVLAQCGAAQAWVHMVAQLAAYGKLSGVRREIVAKTFRYLILADRRLRVATADKEHAAALEGLEPAIALFSSPLVDIEKQELLDKSKSHDEYRHLESRLFPGGKGWSPAGASGAPSGSAGPAPAGAAGGQHAAPVEAPVPMNGGWFSLAPVASVAAEEESSPASHAETWAASAQAALWGAVAASRMALQVRI